MKKVIAFILVSFLLISSIPAMADVFSVGSLNLKNMTIEQLADLKDQIDFYIWNSSDWQEVTVPQGVYLVGRDIPEGHWTVRCANEKSYASISWGEYLSDNGESIAWRGKYSTMNEVEGKKYSLYREGDLTEYSFEAKRGLYVVIKYCSVIFTPYAGKPSLGFK